MSVGQAIGGAVGAIAGFMLPGVGWAIGAQVGLMVGGYIDPPPGPHSEGPRLSDLTAQTSTYGAGKTRAYGTVAVTGNVFWLEGDKYVEHAHEQESGGKGSGGGATQTTYTYSATFAVALTEGQEITGIRRLWVGDRLIYDAGSDNVESVIASNSGGGFLSGSQIWQDVGTWWINALATGQNWKLYTGADDQEAEPRMQADKGAANVSAYPGRAYIVFYDLDLTEHYSNSLLAAQVKAEIVTSGPGSLGYTEIGSLDTANINGWAGEGSLASILIAPNAVGYGTIFYQPWDGAVFGSGFRTHEYAVVDEAAGSVSDAMDGSGYLHISPPQIRLTQSDELCTILLEDTSNYGEYSRLVKHTAAGAERSLEIGGSALVNYVFGAIDGGEIFLSSNSLNAKPIAKFTGTSLIGYSADSYAPSCIAVSENFVFVSAYSSINTGTQTIYKLNRGTLALDSTITVSAKNIDLGLYVVSDDLIYTRSEKNVYKIEDGVLVDTFIDCVPMPSGLWKPFAVFNDSPPYIVSVDPYDTSYYQGKIYLAAPQIDQNVAKLRDIVTYECGLAGLDSSDLDLSGLANADVRGYRVTGVSAPRSALEPLQAAWPFDVYQKGYKVGFKSRGGAAVATIAEEDLGAGARNDAPVLLPVAREMETQIARTVTVKHLDMDRDYEIGEQTAPERPGVSSVEPRQVELPIVLTADEAAQVADVLNAKEWAERVRFGPFSLPPTYANLEPTDVVTINHRNRSWEARLTRVEYLPDGRLTCDAVLTASAAYDSSASGSNPVVLGQSLVPLAGSSRVILLDIPRIRSEQDVTGISAVMYGFTAAWPGGVLVRSDDQGTTWQPTQGFNNKARVFTVTETGAAANSYSIDQATVLTLTPAHDAAIPYSITEDQLYAHQNLAAWGADGRWEIVAFKTVTDNSGTYTVKDFLRGLYGSEWASGLHASGDLLVMLDTATAGFIGLPTSAIGSERLWRGVTQGYSVSTAANIADTYEANNLKPLSPVDINGNREPNNKDWTIEWQQRTRWPVEVFSGQTVPLGETAEDYEVDVFADSGYSTLKRTISGISTATALYSSAQQVADFGSNQHTLYLKVYQVSSVAGRGIPLQTSIVRIVAEDPYGEFVKLLMHMSDTSLTDYKGHTITKNGNAQRVVDATTFSGYAADFDGTGDSLTTPYVTSDFDWWSQSFTLEFFITVDDLSTVSYNDGGQINSAVIGNASTTSTQNYWSFGPLADGTIRFYYFAGFAISVTSTSTISAASRTHLALCSDSSGIRIYMGGVRVANSTVSGTPQSSVTYPLAVGQINNRSINARIDQLRITRGGPTARYTGTTYTVPTTAFPDP